jgi:hypothetical protein
VKWWIDPGLDGDVYGDEPYLYGALLSSINVLNIGGKGDTAAAQDPQEEKEGEAVVYEEGAEGDGHDVRTKHNIPAASAQRQKYFLTEGRRKEYEFEAGREHKCDFFNPYLDFNEFKLKIGYGLPPISIIGHWDGQPLRYVYCLLFFFSALFFLSSRLVRSACITPYIIYSLYTMKPDVLDRGLTNQVPILLDTCSRTARPIRNSSS